MFIKLKSGYMLNLFWVLDITMDPHDNTKIIIYLVNGTTVIEAYESESEAQDAKQELDEQMTNALPNLQPIVVDQLPTENIKPGRVYAVPSRDSESGDMFEEFIYQNGKWESLGVQKGTLKNYYLKTEIDQMLSWKEY